MSEYKKTSIIEQLPNELFLEIFRYINARDLHRGWSKLNKRFTSIIRSVSMNAHLTEKHDYKIYKPCFCFYPSQFIYIRIEQICDIPSTFNVSYFSNICSLHLGVATMEQYDQITSKNMPHLTHLTIAELQAQRNPILLLCGSEQFVHLKTCQVPYFFSTSVQLQACETVRSLHLNFCSLEIFLGQVKVYFPNLLYFETTFRSNSTYYQPNIMAPHTTMRHLKIQLKEQARLGVLDFLLTVIPELQFLEFSCENDCDIQFVN